MIVIINTK